MPSTPSIAPSDAPPSYNAATSSLHQNDNAQLAELSSQEDDIPESTPPPFTYPPQTLALPYSSHLITPLPTSINPSPRPLYELNRPLNIYSSSIGLYSIEPYTRLRDDGRCVSLSERNYLFKIYESIQLPRDGKHTRVSAQRRSLGDGFILKKDSSITGPKWEARKCDENEKCEDTCLFMAKEGTGKRRQCLAWKDASGRTIAIDEKVENMSEWERRLNVTVDLGRRELDTLVAIWVASVWQDKRREWKNEDKVEKKMEQQKRREEEGQLRTRLHDVKEALGIGYGVKPGPRNRGPPTIGENGRIKWS
ncbi:hypothetical protein F5884DRAFT_831146 [Xylogone sp. PMI_703]|nr:hypothetical protein F5884DRAFT_831146 [Xylogone sp. PMI_703]